VVSLWHPLGESTEQCPVKFYADAEAVLNRLPRRGAAMVLKTQDEMVLPNHMIATTWLSSCGSSREQFGLPETFTLDACRHGGMTELEEAELTDGEGRALSGHRTKCAYEGYAKRTLERALPATRKRYAHALANAQGTSVRNTTRSGVQNEADSEDAAIA